MKRFRSVPKILKINNIDGYEVSCLFNNGKSKIIDFKDLFINEFKVSKNHPAYKLLNDITEFNQIQIIGNTIGWKNTGVRSKDEDGNEVFYNYDLDPLVLYRNSKPDNERDMVIGMMIKEARKEAGLTQEELAKRSGTTKHYISRIENNKSDIELLTLKKIIEAGLGKRLNIKIS